MHTEGSAIVPPTVLVWLATCALLAACGTPAGGGAGPIDDDATPDPAPTTGLECGDNTLGGCIEATLFGMLASVYDPPPYWTVTYEAEFVAVEGSPSDGDSEYMTCVAAGEDGR